VFQSQTSPEFVPRTPGRPIFQSSSILFPNPSSIKAHVLQLVWCWTVFTCFSQENFMNITVTGHHVEVTSSMRNYVEEKLRRLQRHSENLFDIQVILSVEKVRQKAEATIHVSGSRLYADATNPDMYASIDLLMDKLDRQLIRQKEKTKSRRGSKPIPLQDSESLMV